MTEDLTGIVVYRAGNLTGRITNAAIYAVAVLLFLTPASSTAWAQGLPTKSCTVNGTTIQAYLCLDDIVVVDGSGYNGSGLAPSDPNFNGKKVGGIYLVDPTSGNQTPISTGGYLGQAANLTLEPGTGKLLASTRTYGVIRVDPKDGSQEVLLKGGTGWGTGFPTFVAAGTDGTTVTESFIYPGGITIDPMDSSILVTDTGIRLNACTDPNNITTCASDPGKIIRIKKGQGAGVYAGNAIVAKGGFLSDPFDLVVDGGSSLYVTDMNAVLGGAADPGKGGVIYLNASTNPPYQQSVFFSSYAQNPSTIPYGCPMGITINALGTIFATVFTFNGYGCAPQAVFSLTPGANPPTVSTVVNGFPFQYPFGMYPDRSGRILIADEGSGYGCGGTIFRLDLSKPIVTSGSLTDLNPFALSPIAGGNGSSTPCTPPNQAYLVTPADVAVVKVAVAANISTPPSVTINGAPGSSPEGTAISLTSSVTPFGTYNYAWTVTKTRNGTTTSYSTGSAASLTFSPDDDGTYVVTLSATGTGPTGTDSKTISVFNVPPAVAISGIPVSSSEGTAIILTSIVSDPSPADTAAGFIYSWTVLKNGNPFASGSSPSLTFTPDHSGSYVVTLSVRDKDGGTGPATTTINVSNLPPVITTVTGPTTPKLSGSTITMTAHFRDSGAAETHSCTIVWDDGTTTTAPASETNGSGSCTQTHTYTTAGIYAVGVTVTDDGGLSASSVFQFVVVFDTTEGFVTGSGSIQSAAGSYVADPTLKGTARFGFHVRYAKGALVPSGTNMFRFRLGNLNFQGTAFEWLVIVGANAQYKGSGTINGTGNFEFLVTITDGQQTGGGGVDKYRIKLVDNSTGQVIYDNVKGAPDDIDTANPEPISTGKVVIFINTPLAISTLSLSATTINEGDQTTLTGTFTDPDVGDTHKITINWGDGSSNTVINLIAGTFNFSAIHKYLDNPAGIPTGGTFTINVTVADNRNGTAAGSTSVTVNNVAPVIKGITATVQTLPLWVNFTDVGRLDTHTCTVAWGDAHTSSFPASETQGSGSCTSGHTYASPGTYVATVTVTDKDGASVSANFNVASN